MKSQFEKVIQFHNKFGLSYNQGPRTLPKEEQDFRLTCLHEELSEYELAVAFSDRAEQLDALVDLVYFALGTAHRNGFPFDKAFNIVHSTNMAKEVKADNQRRGFHLEVTKPEGWKSPNLTELVKTRSLKGQLKGLITIDGPDGSGKTTLAKRIAELFGGEYIHLTWFPTNEENLNHYRVGALMYATALAKDRIVVIERPWISHVAYSRVYRNEQGYPVSEWREMAETAQILGILAVPSDRSQWIEDYIKLTKSRDEMYVNEKSYKMEKIYEIFNALSRGVPTPHVSMPLLDFKNYTTYDMHSTPESGLDDWIIENLIGLKTND